MESGSHFLYPIKGGDIMTNLYTCEQVAERYGVKTLTVWDWIRNKKLAAIKIGKSYRVTDADLTAFEEANRTV